MGARTPAWQRAFCWGGNLAILLLAIGPSARAVWIHALGLSNAWEWLLLAFPATYVYAYACLAAVAYPALALLKNFPLMRAEDARKPVVLALNLLHFVLAVGAAGFWQAVAWVSYPLLKDGQLRIVPLYPWPDWSFWEEWLALTTA